MSSFLSSSFSIFSTRSNSDSTCRTYASRSGTAFLSSSHRSIQLNSSAVIMYRGVSQSGQSALFSRALLLVPLLLRGCLNPFEVNDRLAYPLQRGTHLALVPIVLPVVCQ